MSLLLLAASAQAVMLVTVPYDDVDRDLTDTVCRTAAGECTLRAAVQQANYNGVAERIELGEDVYVLTLPNPGGIPEDASDAGDLDVLVPLEIVGVGVTRSVIDASAVYDRALHLPDAVTTSLHVERLQIRGGAISYDDGGAIKVDERLSSLTARLVWVTDNVAGRSGGGIYSQGPVEIERSVVSWNMATTGNGGGIYVARDLLIRESTVESNWAQQQGGGVYSLAVGPYDIAIKRSTIAGNIASLFSGGGLYVAPRDNDHHTAVHNSTFSGNRAGLAGGGMAVFAGELELGHATVTDNTANIGGGLAQVDTLASTTAQFRTFNSVIGDNQALAAGGGDDCVGTVYSDGGNLVGTDVDCVFIAVPSDQLNVAPDLGPLQWNWGWNRTHVPNAGSPAIDGADDAQCPVVDQRVLPRPFGAHCDVGSVERQQ